MPVIDVRGSWSNRLWVVCTSQGISTSGIKCLPSNSGRLFTDQVLVCRLVVVPSLGSGHGSPNRRPRHRPVIVVCVRVRRLGLGDPDRTRPRVRVSGGFPDSILVMFFGTEETFNSRSTTPSFHSYTHRTGVVHGVPLR